MSVFAPNWKLNYEYKTNVMVPIYTREMMRMAVRKNPIYFFTDLIKTGFIMTCYYLHYIGSKIMRTQFAKDVDVINDQINYKPSLTFYIKTGITVARAYFFWKKKVY